MAIYCIKGRPVPLHRPRFGRGKVYDSQKMEKEAFGWELKLQGASLYGKAVRLEVEFRFALPRRGNVNPGAPYIGRPDLDNLMKFVMDASLGILYEDDTLVTEMVARKEYWPEACTIIEVTEVE